MDTSNNKVAMMTKTAMFAAMITLVTGYIFHIPMGGNSGYIHLGDTLIYLAACCLPFPYAMVAASMGAALADCLTGAAVWAIPTIIIKALMILPFTSKSEKILCRRNVIGVVLSGLICCIGYGIAQAIMLGTWAGLLFPNPWIQSAACGVLFVTFAAAIDKSGLKHIISGKKVCNTTN